MKITYTGIRHNLSTRLQEKLDLKFQKLSKLLDGPGGEKAAHVVVTKERHLHNAEITLHYYDHELVGEGSDGDIFNAVSGALTKLEKQAVKHRARWRERVRRAPRTSNTAGAEALEEPGIDKPAATKPRVYRVRTHERRRPLTLGEALLLMEDGRAYLAYRSSDRPYDQHPKVNMLVRRPDGHFDLIET